MMQMLKAIYKRYLPTIAGGLIGMGLVDLYKKVEFDLSVWLLRLVVFIVLTFITGAIEYKQGKLK